MLGDRVGPLPHIWGVRGQRTEGRETTGERSQAGRQKGRGQPGEEVVWRVGRRETEKISLLKPKN